MELARITTKGQITIPLEIRKKLNLKDGDKVIFIEEDSKIVFANSAMIALREIQEAMKGKAAEAGFFSEEDVNRFVEEVRKEYWESKNENND